MSAAKKSVVRRIRTTKTWSWIVIPAHNPHVYVPFPSKAAAEDAGRAFEGGRPAKIENYIHFPVPEWMRLKLRLPTLTVPDVKRIPGFKEWRPIDRDTFHADRAEAVNATMELTVYVPGESRAHRVYLTSEPHAVPTMVMTA